MTSSKRLILSLLLLLLLTIALHAGEGLNMDALKAAEERGNYDDFEAELKKLLPVGADEERIIYVLTNLGWEFRLSQPHNAYLASRKLRRPLLKTRAMITVHMDSERRVKDVEVSVSSAISLG